MNTTLIIQPAFRKHIALPQDHGSWVFLFSPLLIGLAAGRAWNLGGLILTLACLAAFMLRQPVSIAVKTLSGRRSQAERPVAVFWTLVYALTGLLAATGLYALGYGYLLWLAVPAIPVFAWHLWLISKRSERRQVGVEVVGSGVLALAAPAAFWLGVGEMQVDGWWLFGLTWFQSAASIVYAYLRLEQREWKQMPSVQGRVMAGWRALSYTSANLAACLTLSLLGELPVWIWIPFAVQWVESIYGTLVPAIGYKPTRIGIRQLIVSCLFTVLFMVFWN